jgi:hypothetical protein
MGHDVFDGHGVGFGERRVELQHRPHVLNREEPARREVHT